MRFVWCVLLVIGCDAQEQPGRNRSRTLLRGPLRRAVRGGPRQRAEAAGRGTRRCGRAVPCRRQRVSPRRLRSADAVGAGHRTDGICPPCHPRLGRALRSARRQRGPRALLARRVRGARSRPEGRRAPLPAGGGARRRAALSPLRDGALIRCALLALDRRRQSPPIRGRDADTLIRLPTRCGQVLRSGGELHSRLGDQRFTATFGDWALANPRTRRR